MNKKELLALIFILLVGIGVVAGIKHKNRLEKPSNNTAEQKWEEWNTNPIQPIQPVPPTTPQTQPPVQPTPPATPPVLTQPKSYSEAVQQSKQSGKDMMLYFTASWCSHCRRMEPTFSNQDVQKALEKYVFYKIDCDKEREAVEKYNVKSIPVCIIATSAEVVKKKEEGVQQPARLVRWLESN